MLFDFAFSESTNLMAGGTISGPVSLWKYSLEENTMEGILKHHTDAVRCIEFYDDNLCMLPPNSLVYTGSSDQRACLVDIEKKAVVFDSKKVVSF